MKTSLTSFLITIGFLLNGNVVPAFETDQYNLPPMPLADIGDEVSAYVEGGFRNAVAKVNAEIDKSLSCLKLKAKGCGSIDAERRKLAHLHSNDAVAYEFFLLIGDGNLFVTRFGRWMRAHKFRAQPDRFKTEFSESIFVLNPTNYLTISPTVRLFGAELGVDKLEHFFQQGYQYYQIEKEAGRRGLSGPEAAKKAVSWGQRTERTYFGLLASGVYSNADLYANYAGMRFYQGFSKPLKVEGKARPAIAELKNGSWHIDPSILRENFLKPFITDHMNEALNPSAFRITLVRSVRRAVKKHSCPEWRQTYPGLTQSAMAARSKALELWNGEDYGFTPKTRMVTIAETCFKSEAPSLW